MTTAGKDGKNKKKRVVFELLAEPGSSVFVAGSFNDWNPQDKQLHDKDGDGVYSRGVMLAPGTYEYKFVVNGVWTVNPNCQDWTTNDQGSLNSVITVR